MRNKYNIFTLGCQQNVADTERIAKNLNELGYKSASEKAADFVIVNACSVRQSAIDRIWGKIRIWQEQGKKIYLTGCVLTADKQKFEAKNIPFYKIGDLNHVLKGNIQSKKQFKPQPKASARQSPALIPIMTGCNNFCSYCAVPYTRGRERSRPMKDILKDIQNALTNGYKEFLLLGQNVNSYGIKNYNDRMTFLQIHNSNFIKLLKKIDDLPAEFQFNFISSNPQDMTAELIDCLASLKKWPRELHLAMQSGDDEILKKMNRRYASKQYLNLVSNLKLKIKNLKLSTDIIVGFPGETKKQFNNTVKICRKIKFDKAYIAQYSPRPGTAASKLQDDVPRAEKKRRWLLLDQLINK